MRHAPVTSPYHSLTYFLTNVQSGVAFLSRCCVLPASQRFRCCPLRNYCRHSLVTQLYHNVTDALLQLRHLLLSLVISRASISRFTRLVHIILAAVCFGQTPLCSLVSGSFRRMRHSHLPVPKSFASFFFSLFTIRLWSRILFYHC